MTNLKSTDNPHNLDKDQRKILAEMKADLAKARMVATEVFGGTPSNETLIEVCTRVLCFEEDTDQMEAAGELAISLEIARQPDVFGPEAGTIEAFCVFDSLFAEEE